MLATVMSFAVVGLLWAIFVQSSWHKVSQLQRFRAAVAAYKIGPAQMVGVFAFAALTVEVCMVAGLVLAPAWILLGAGCLLLVYAAAIGVNVVRGRSEIDCGCGDEPTPVSWSLVVRNFVLAGMAFFASFSLASHGLGFESMTFMAWLLSVTAAVTLFVFYMACEQMFANNGRRHRYWPEAV